LRTVHFPEKDIRQCPSRVLNKKSNPRRNQWIRFGNGGEPILLGYKFAFEEEFAEVDETPLLVQQRALQVSGRNLPTLVENFSQPLLLHRL
jgi:hypothetical protein